MQLGEAQAAAQARAFPVKIGSITIWPWQPTALARISGPTGDSPEGSVTLGAPPDELGPGGQDWAFPPPNKEAHSADGYQHFARSIRKNARHGGALRIDHVMRFFRLFWIPEGLTAREGVYAAVTT